jgi:integrase
VAAPRLAGSSRAPDLPVLAERSAVIGKRFGRLEAEMDLGPEHVFHSIRKTVATLLEDAQCPEGIAADILGHDEPTMTHGLYSGGSSMATRREWIEKAIRYETDGFH